MRAGAWMVAGFTRSARPRPESSSRYPAARSGAFARNAAVLARVLVHVVSQRLGHASPVVAMTVYAHVLPGNQREAASTFARLIREARTA